MKCTFTGHNLKVFILETSDDDEEEIDMTLDEEEMEVDDNDMKLFDDENDMMLDEELLDEDEGHEMD